MTRATRYAAQGMLVCVALAVFWLACVFTVRWHELLVGAGAVLLSVVSTLFVVRTLPLEFRPTPGEILQIWRVAGYVVIDLAQITYVLLLDLAGRRAPSIFRSAPWGPAQNNGRDTAKRALAVAYTTVSPNCVVVGIDCGRHQILMHNLKRSPVPQMMRNLGAGAER